MVGHNPYFNRWFSAIFKIVDSPLELQRHNPYFNRWFSAIGDFINYDLFKKAVTILILIDGFLQYSNQRFWITIKRESQSLF